MANSIVTDPKVLDTAVTDFITGTVQGGVTIKKLIWTSIGSDGDDLIIKNYNQTRVVFQLKGLANVPYTIDFTSSPYYVPDGLSLTTIDSGTVYIY